MKRILFTSCFLFFFLFAKAQTFQIKEIATSIGNWEGKLTYLDYTSGSPFTMLANIKISLTENKKGYIMGYEYPKEPHANSKDTTYANDTSFGKEKIIEFEKAANGYKLVTEIAGEDGNEHKKATLRHTYHLIANSFSIIKEVKFEGTDKWIKRNEYLLNRIKNAYKISSFLQEGPKAPNTHYIGEAWLNSVLQGDAELNFNITKATFRKNSTLDWHKHSTPQVLIVVDGEGYYQERGMDAIIMKKGDVIRCAKDTEHWHTASKENLVIYLAIYDGSKPTIWTEQLTQEYYDSIANKLKAAKK